MPCDGTVPESDAWNGGRARGVSRAMPATPVIVRLIGVYHADGTLRGELAYFVGARLGRAHCALCDITHGAVRKRTAWQRCVDGLPVPFDTYHRDDQPDAVREATRDTTPFVVAETTAGIVTLVGPDELDACDSSVDALVTAIEHAVDANALDWPAAHTT